MADTANGSPLFDAVREACLPARWSRGIELTRADAVSSDGIDDDTYYFRVTTRGGMACPRVTLFPDDPDWDCDCPSRERVCEHVAAAVIAWHQAIERGAEVPSIGEAAGRVGYRLTRQSGGLALERVIVRGATESLLEATLVSVAEGRVGGPRFAATQEDLKAELALGTHRRGVLAQQHLPRLFACLAHCRDVRLDGESIAISAKPLLPLAQVTDREEGFMVRIVADPSISERFANGVVRCDATLRVLGEAGLTARERRDFGQGRTFGPDETAELVTRVLPALGKRIPVEVRTDRLPETTRARPWILFDVNRDDRKLSVLATLVYGDPPTARIDGDRLVPLGGTVPLRDEAAERREVARLGHLGLTLGVRAEFDGAEAVAFRAGLERFDDRVSKPALDYFRATGPLVPRVEIDGDRFDVVFESRGRADPAEVMRAFRAGESMVPLLGGGWAPLPEDWLQRFGHRIADLLAARERDGNLPRCCLPDLARLCEELDCPVPPAAKRLAALAGEFRGLPVARLPDDLRTELRPYQRSGVDWLCFLRDARIGALLADDMGLGKTLQALCAMRSPSLVVAPTSVLHNWKDEIARHRPALHCSIYHGPKRLLDPRADVTLTTYTILRMDGDALAERDWETVVLDEAQYIKNPDSQVAAAAFRLPSTFRLALTGTPVENRLDELWSQFRFINPGLLGRRADFQERYAEPVGRGEPGAAGRLRDRIRPFLLRRLKRDVARELPPRTDMVLYCSLSEAERETYDAIRAATLREVTSRLGRGGNVLAALEALLRLRQAACHRGLVPGHQAHGSSKLDRLIEALADVVSEGHKALVFSQWTSLLDLAEPHLRDAGIEFLRLDGSTRDRGGVVSRFQREDGPPVMIVSLKAGGTGLNLTAADHIFLLDPWWNPAVEDQAADRAHRIGQTRPVMVYRLVAEETVEERILALQGSKRELAAAALGGAEAAAGLTRDDLMALLD